jgi:hypothetical protein
MLSFPRPLNAWKTDGFRPILKAEIEGMGAEYLPLDEGTSQGGFVDDSKITATVLSVKDEANSIAAEVGVFFTEIVAGCSCGDEPDSLKAYCRMRILIEKATANARISVIPE